MFAASDVTCTRNIGAVVLPMDQPTDCPNDPASSLDLPNNRQLCRTFGPAMAFPPQISKPSKLGFRRPDHSKHEFGRSEPGENIDHKSRNHFGRSGRQHRRELIDRVDSRWFIAKQNISIQMFALHAAGLT